LRGGALACTTFLNLGTSAPNIVAMTLPACEKKLNVREDATYSENDEEGHAPMVPQVDVRALEEFAKGRRQFREVRRRKLNALGAVVEGRR